MRRNIPLNYFPKKATNQMTHNNQNVDSDELFDQETIEEEDFEIPAFLRKQKF